MSDEKRDSIVKQSSQKGESLAGLSLDEFSDDVADFLKPLDINGNKFIEKDEIVLAARALYKERRKNSRLKSLVFLMIMGYILFVSTIIGLVYLIVKMNKDTAVLKGSSVLMTTTSDMEPVPVSVNTNKVSMSLGLILFLPQEIVSKITSLVLYNDKSGAKLYRTVASIDIIPEESFNITTTVGDTLTWDSSDFDNDIMKVALNDGTSYNKSALCEECSAFNVVPNDEQVQAAVNAYKEAFGLDDVGKSEDDPSNRNLWGFDGNLGGDRCGGTTGQ
eukprot:CAMPEP_0172507030 /NCGR_PEP_ID=MMETSP1066-20121228/200644_1 /TAXON_ID=671091 /ORGANISM="Coscinodiscus wailesii, Strain CCMP2513" /LENGTH=275 /DNA_ID=CAMNT_0013284385 /DNA_START=49 /DNA_END=876 /DNA_ORIENTATION=+